MPRIVVLDGHTLNPGDLSWNEFERLGPVTVHARTAPADVVARSREAELVLTNKAPLSAEAIAQLPKLRYIGVLATGYNVVDVGAAKGRGVMVTNVPAYGTASVAQHAFALLLELTNHTARHAQSVREGRWTKAADWCYWDAPLVELAGLTLGVIGAGRIGQAVARLGEAFGMKVRYARRADGAAALEPLLRESDVVTLHCPLTPETKHLINAKTLGWMKPSAFLLNTGRGPLIDEPALAVALNEGRIAGAALDVLSTEPPRADNPLITARNCIITPHLAWGTTAARARLMHIAAENLRCFLAGQPQNAV